MNDPFEILGIPPAFDVDLPAVERRVRAISSAVHPDRHVGGTPTDRRAALGKAVEVNDAWRVVRDPITRAEALIARASAAPRPAGDAKPDAAFLMETMERREALSEARARRDAPAVARLAAEVAALDAAVSARFAAASREGEARVHDMIGAVAEMRYYRRFLDEVGAIEDDLASTANLP